MLSMTRWVSASTAMLVRFGVSLLLAAGSIASAVAGANPPFEPQVVQFTYWGVGGIAAPDRRGQGPGTVATTVFASNEVVLIHGERGAPVAGDRLAVGEAPVGLVAGDLDGDHRDDLVVLNFWSTDLSVLMARPGGRFAAERRQPLRSGVIPDDLGFPAVQTMALADFDADGCLDLVLMTRSGIELMRGDCRGALRPAGRVVSGYFHFALVSADFDGDGNADLAASRVTDDVVILRGRGDGTFDALPAVKAGILSQGLAAGDVNGDGLPDLVTANQLAGDQQEPDGDVSVLLGGGGGTLRPAVRYRAGRGTLAVALGDFDRDGDLDIAAGNLNSSDVSLFTGHGDGTFADERRLHIGPDPQQLLAIDQDRDGALDLVASLSPTAVGFVAGRGDGTFDAPDVVSHPMIPRSLAVADLDRDGHRDLIVAGRQLGRQPGDLAILPGTGEGRFGPAIVLDVNPEDELFGASPADFDEDGLGDLAVLGDFESVGVILGRPGWTFSPVSWTPTGLIPRSLAIADYDRDGHLDLAVAHTQGAGIVLLMGRGDGGFRPGVSMPGDYLDQVAAGDLDGDGFVDLAASGNRVEPAGGYRNGIFVWSGDGRGGFGAPLLLEVDQQAYRVGLGDIDGDRRLDILAISSNRVILFRNLGGGSFGPAVPYFEAWGTGGLYLVVADVSRDGLADAVLLQLNEELITILEGSRDGTLREAGSTVPGLRPGALAAADLDGDGAVDLATADSGEVDAFVGSRPTVTLLWSHAQAPNRPAAIDPPAPHRSVPPRRPR